MATFPVRTSGQGVSASVSAFGVGRLTAQPKTRAVWWAQQDLNL
jgi:hypothetical protein